MSDASTRVHVVSPTAMLLIPATDLQVEAKIPGTPAQEDGDSDSDNYSDFTEPKKRKQLRREKHEEKQRKKALELAAAISTLDIAQNPTLYPPSDSVYEQFAPSQPPSQSRKEKRKEKKKRHDSALPTPSDTDAEVPVQQPPNPSKQKHNPTNQHLTSIPPLLMAKPAAQTAYPLLVASIGNPGASFANTLHSAGHIVTSSLSHAKNYTPFQKGLSGLVSRPQPTHLAFSLTGFRRVESEHDVYDSWTFWQSASLMNVSGNGVKRAYNEWLREIRRQTGESTLQGRLVVVHDELESVLGKVTIRDGAASAKGHNGIKSCQQQLAGVKWWRVGVGIGRPESRDPNVVSKYVLGKMTAFQKSQLEQSVVPVFKALEEIAAGKK